jgi:hypothetical protein
MNAKSIPVISIFIISISVIFCSCEEPPEKNEKDFQQNLSSFTSTMDKLDSTLDLMDQLQNKVNEVEEDRAKGKISDEEAIDKLNKLNNTIGRQIAKTSNLNPISGLPRWAEKLGLTEPTGLTFDSDFSQSTSEHNENEGFNSVILIYHGNYELAMQQADIIAHKANIPLSQDFKDALLLSQKYGIESIKGASYMNFEIGSENNLRYNISITVDDDGTLTINATDTDALVRQLKGNE